MTRAPGPARAADAFGRMEEALSRRLDLFERRVTRRLAVMSAVVVVAKAAVDVLSPAR